MRPKSLAIFDLGGVVFRHSFDNALRYWSKTGHQDFEGIRTRFSHDEAYAQHERGELSIRQYKDHVAQTLGLDISLEDFVTGWNAIFMEEIPGIRTLLADLKRRIRIVALSNTNETHCRFMNQAYGGVFGEFEQIYFSHQIRCRKPEAQAYWTVLDAEKTQPEEAVFFDDLLPNVEGARRVGLAAVVVDNNRSIFDGLEKHGV